MRGTVVTAAGLDLTVLVGTFGAAGITDAWVLTNDAGDRLLFDPEPDLLVCVLDPNAAERTDPSPPGFTNLDVMIRAGQAAGRGVPTLIIAPPPLVLSAPIAGTDVVYCPLDRASALEDHVWAFTQSAQPREHRNVAQSTRLVVPHRYEAELHRLQERYPNQGFERAVERLVADLLREAGAALPGIDGGVDLAFIASEDSPGIMLMQVAAGKLSHTGLNRAEEQLEKYVHVSRAKLGVLVYYDVDQKPLPARQPREAVVRIPLERLIEQLGARKLPDVIAAAVAQRGSVAL
jgi:hypothetical protein